MNLFFSDEKYDTTSVPNDPLKPNEIKFSKRKGYGLYINCNNPERLLQNEHIDVLNKCIKKNHLCYEEVFFTMEHNNLIEKDIYKNNFYIILWIEMIYQYI